jgi:two-component system, NarL family, response regulator LiaR
MENQQQPITLLIVDDHIVVRQGLRTFLETRPKLKVIGDAASGEEALSMVEQYASGCSAGRSVMPGMDGVEVTRRIRDLSPVLR